MFASASHLDLGIFVGPEKPVQIDTILSSPWPILIDYKCMYEDITGIALWRLRTVLMYHHDRVRKIFFDGTRPNFDKFFKATNNAFPLLDSLSLRFRDDYEPKIPDIFIRGPDLSDLHLRRLSLHGGASLASISGLLLSATALTDLFLLLCDTAFGSSSEATLLTCLQGMPCLRSFHLIIPSPRPLDSTSRPSTTKDIVLLPKLTCFHYIGRSVLLDALVAGLSAPSLQDVSIQFAGETLPPIVHLPRFISEIEEHYHAVYVAILGFYFRLSLLTRSKRIDCGHPHFTLGPNTLGLDTPGLDTPGLDTLCLEMSIPRETIVRQEKIMRISSALSARFTTMEELRVTFDTTDADVWENFIPWRRFLQQIPNIKALRTEGGKNDWIARILLQDHKGPDDDALAFLPVLEEIELVENTLLTDESQRGPQLTAFEPFISARQQADRPVKVFFGPSRTSDCCG